MTYFLVMGSLALSVLFTLGWALSRLLRWVASGFPLGSDKHAGKARGAATRRTSRASAAKAKPKPQPKAKPSPAKSSRTRPDSKPPSEPWRITRRLAAWRSSIALALVAALIYLVARLVEHGMSFRPPYTAPSGFDALVDGVGWLAAGLILIALLHRLAARRCR